MCISMMQKELQNQKGQVLVGPIFENVYLSNLFDESLCYHLY